jgi:hypothetical protein
MILVRERRQSIGLPQRFEFRAGDLNEVDGRHLFPAIRLHRLELPDVVVENLAALNDLFGPDTRNFGRGHDGDMGYQLIAFTWGQLNTGFVQRIEQTPNEAVRHREQQPTRVRQVESTRQAVGRLGFGSGLDDPARPSSGGEPLVVDDLLGGGSGWIRDTGPAHA